MHPGKIKAKTAYLWSCIEFRFKVCGNYDYRLALVLEKQISDLHIAESRRISFENDIQI
jgi:hypothetical protein